MCQKRFWNISHRSGRISRIPALACLARKRAQVAVNLTTRACLVAMTFAAPVDVTGAANGWAPVRSGRSHRSDFVPFLCGGLQQEAVSTQISLMPLKIAERDGLQVAAGQ